MTPTMIYSPELNMMLVPIKITCTECKGKKQIFNPYFCISWDITQHVWWKTCPTCKGEGFYTVNHL